MCPRFRLVSALDDKMINEISNVVSDLAIRYMYRAFIIGLAIGLMIGAVGSYFVYRGH